MLEIGQSVPALIICLPTQNFSGGNLILSLEIISHEIGPFGIKLLIKSGIAEDDPVD
jgi:hypothetical protein